MASPTVEVPTTTDEPTPPSARSSLSKRVSASSSPAPPPQQPQSTAGATAETGTSPPSEPRRSVGGGAPGSPPAAAAVVAGAPEGSSPPRKSVTAGAAGESSPSSEPRKSVTAGAAGESSPSSEPRKSVTAGSAGESSPSSQPRKSVIAGAVGATPAGSPTTPASPSAQSPAPSTPGSTKEVSGEPVKKTPPTLVWDYSQPLPNRFFRPALTDLCFPVLAKNFAKFPGFGNLPQDERLRVVDEIALDLPLNLAADLIPEEPYWKRRVQSKWRNCDINAHGRSWKQLFFERNLAEALERFDRTVDKESSLEDLIKTSAPYVHNLDIVELPSHLSFLLLFNALNRSLQL